MTYWSPACIESKITAVSGDRWRTRSVTSKLFSPGIASATINRHDFGVSWNSTLNRGGVVVGNTVEITIDAEAILQEE